MFSVVVLVFGLACFLGLRITGATASTRAAVSRAFLINELDGSLYYWVLLVTVRISILLIEIS